MTRIDFYVLEAAEQDLLLRLACRLAEKAFHSGSRVYCHVGDDAQANELTDRLWSYRADSFLPARRTTAEIGADDVLVVGCGDPPESHHDVLINLSEELPPAYSRFDRVLELVLTTHEALEASRRKFVWYRDHGYDRRTHKLQPEQIS